jgi:tetratricopeptide (TPR) repeat protein
MIFLLKKDVEESKKMALSKVSKELVITPEEKYQALLRSLRRTKGFGILFVQCSPAEASDLIAKVKQDLPQKKIDVLALKESIDNLYELIDCRPDRDELNILFIQGIEKSLEEYIKPGYGGQGDYYKLDTVPQILNHLNQQRESFRDHFSSICFVFIVPLFALKYFIHRAPDFFDWRSGVFTFPMDPKLVEEESRRVILSRDYKKDLKLDLNQINRELFSIDQLLEGSPNHFAGLLSRQAELLYKRGQILSAPQDYKGAIASFDKALRIQPGDYHAWSSRGNALIELGRYEEAIASHDKALDIKPDHYWAWNSRGRALSALQRYKEAIASHDKALKIQPGDYWSWTSRGRAFSKLERYEEAIASYDKALEVQPDYYWALTSRGRALSELERYEEAIDSYTKSSEIKPDYYWTWYYKAEALSKLGRHEEEKRCLERALQLEKSDYNEEKASLERARQLEKSNDNHSVG